MKYVLWFLAVCLLGCSGDNATGSRVFAPEDLTVLGNLSILGEPSSAEEDPSSFIRISGGVDSQSGVALTGLAVSVRVLGENAPPNWVRVKRAVGPPRSPLADRVLLSRALCWTAWISERVKSLK